MALKLKAESKGGGDYENPEPGNQAAVLVAIVELGTVQREFQGKSYSTNEIYLVWELTTQQMTGSSNNHCVGRVYGLSFSEKSNLRKLISKWIREVKDGEEIDLGKLLGQTCLLDVQAVEGKSYVKLDPLCASKLPKGMNCPPPKRPLTQWEIDGSKHLPEHLGWLPFIYGESVCDRIARSEEWRAKVRGNGQVKGDEGEITDDNNGDNNEKDIPF